MTQQRWHVSRPNNTWGPFAYTKLPPMVVHDSSKYLIVECTLTRCNLCHDLDKSIPREVFNVGQLLVATSGIYSDYGIIGLYKVVKEFDPELNLEEARANGTLQAVEYAEYWDERN